MGGVYLSSLFDLLANGLSTRVIPHLTMNQGEADYLRTWKYKNTHYLDFWPKFNPKDFFLSEVLELYPGKDPLIVVSVFPSLLKIFIGKIQRRLFGVGKVSQKKATRLRKKIWWTGEDKRPPFREGYDLFVSFDQDDLSQKNVYFPLFYSELLFPNHGSFQRLGGPIPEAISLTRPRARTPTSRFACAFMNNPEPTRLRAVEHLAKYGKVEVFGKISSTPNTQKIPNAEGAKFVLCFENNLFPGYITEKLLDAYLCGAVPLYWGDLGNEPHINRKAFINAKDFDTLEDFAHYVGSLSEIEFERIHREPLLNSVPTPDKLIEAIQKL